jgi:hypothetical protein
MVTNLEVGKPRAMDANAFVRKLPVSNVRDSMSADECLCGSEELDFERVFVNNAGTPLLSLGRAVPAAAPF